MSDASPMEPATILQRVEETEKDVREQLQRGSHIKGVRPPSSVLINPEWLLFFCATLRTALADTRRVEPNYCYDPDNWEVTLEWKDRDLVHGEGDGLLPGKAMLVKTLLCGPDKWVADIPVAEDEAEVRWFDSKEEADAAMAATPEGR